jgi:hypothetical protein
MLKIFVNFINEKYLNFLYERYNDKPITLFIDKIPQSTEELELNPHNIFITNEPSGMFSLDFHHYATVFAHKFSLVLTWDEKILDLCSNAVLFTANAMPDFVDKEYIDSFKTKTKEFEVSFLCGIKDIALGHKLRQEIYKLEDKVIIPKKWFKVLDDFDHENQVRPGYTEYSKDLSHVPEGEYPEHYGKRILFNDSMFNIAIENTKYNNFYTEKIAQAFSTKTVPIYWGCPNIDDLGYDERGIIRFNTPQELIEILNNLTPETYNNMKPYIDYNYEVSLQDTVKNNYTNFFDELIKENNL